MRIALIATLTFAAGLLVGSTLFSGPSEQPGPLIVDVERKASGGDSHEPARDEESAASDPTAQSPSAGPRLEAAGTPGRVTQGQARRAWTRKLLNEAYAEYRQQKETALPAELQAAATSGALEYLRKSIHDYGGWMRSYVDKQRALGTIGDLPKFVLQARGSGNASTDAWPKQLAARAEISDDPLDLSTLPDSDKAMEVYRLTGVPPLDRALVLERIEVVGLLGREGEREAKRGAASLRIHVVGATALDLRGGRGRNIRGTLQGLQVCIPPYDDWRIGVSVHQAAVGLVATGRYVTLEEARTLREEKFRWIQEGDDGVLGDDPVTLQILADHGGGNPRLVRLDGTTNHRVDTMAQADLWDPALDLRNIERSSAWVENAGSVPQGKIYRITRIDWRTRLDPEKSSHSDFVIRYAGKTLVERKAPSGVEDSGTWEGELDVQPGSAKRFEVECSYFGMGEAVVSGEIIYASNVRGK